MSFETDIAENQKRSAEAEEDNRGPAVVVEGSFLTGFRLIGPFNTIDDAVSWHKNNTIGGRLGLSVAIAVIDDPKLAASVT